MTLCLAVARVTCHDLRRFAATLVSILCMSETMNAAIATQIARHLNDRFGIDIPEVDIAAAWREAPYRYSNYDPSIQCAYLGVNCP